MDVKTLKFLLKLLGFPDYRALVSEIKPTNKIKASERNKICQELWDKEIVACREEIKKLTIQPAGKAFLQNKKQLQLPPLELKILNACKNKVITPGVIKNTPPTQREEAINSLIQKGLIKPTQKQLKEVWLTERGKEYLLYEYKPSGHGDTHLSQNMLGSYLLFLRKNLAAPTPIHKPSDQEIVTTIKNLDRELGTNNYLPIFHLRQKLQPHLSRKELDEALYRLEENEQIEMSTLADVSAYTLEEINAGIPQPVGGRKFFLILS